MSNDTLSIVLDKILDEWDPIGILQHTKRIIYMKGSKGEYTNYIPTIIQTYINNNSVFDYLIELQIQLTHDPNDEMLEVIKITSEKILDVLSKCKEEDLHNFTLPGFG